MNNTLETILVLTTGGTIDKQYFDALSKYEITDTMVTKLLAVSRVTHPLQVEELMRKDSIELTDTDREKIVEHVRQSESARIIITHGTDTMTLTARRLSEIADKTIVLTGALAPARFRDSDAAFNLGMAFATAQIAAPGVYIAINGSVFYADNVEKDRQRGCFALKHR